MRILYVSLHWPDRTTCGSEIRSFYIRRALEQLGDVDVVVADVGEEEEHLPGNPALVFKVHRMPRRSCLGRIRWTLDARMPYPHGTGLDPEADEMVAARARDYDMIWFSKLRAANLFRTWSWPRSVVDVDDVPSTMERSLLGNEEALSQRLMATARFVSWRRREKRLGERFSVVAVCSDADRSYLRNLNVVAPIHVIPNGADLVRTELVRRPTIPPRLGFVGLLDYFPNKEGIDWFVQNCWPRVKREMPDARLRLAGKGSEGSLSPKGPDIDGLGWVAALEEEVVTWSAMIVPIRIGAGTRGKIAYGFGRNCPIVSTSLGAFGYDVRDGDEILLADSPDRFAAACVRVMQNPVEAAQVAARAYRKYLQHWSWDAIAPSVWQTAADCIQRNRLP